ncbi:MAG: GGDEF-domain containing protein [Leptospiraceae bacterium]|nr:MAG: GGDEF-domain containing protein [Leptospiraceae bacterium]
MKSQIKISFFIISLGIISTLLIFLFLYIIIYQLFLNFYLNEYTRIIKLYTIQYTKHLDYLLKNEKNNLDQIDKLIETYNLQLKEQNLELSFYRNLNDIENSGISNSIQNAFNNKKTLLLKKDNILYSINPVYNNNKLVGVLIIAKNLENEYSNIEKRLIRIFYATLVLPIIGAIILSWILVHYIKKGISNLKKFSNNIKSVSDINKFNIHSIDFKFYEFNEIYQELKEILSKIQKIAIDKEILKTEMQILEEFIITSEAIKDWVDYISNILIRVKNMIEFYFFYAIFKEREDLIIIYIFHRYKNLNEKKILENKILEELKKTSLYEKGINFNFVYKKISNDYYILNDINVFDTIHKAIMIDKPLIGGILGVGVDISLKEDEIKKLAFESLLATMINFIGSIKAINIYTRELEYYATRDPLTNLYNQRVFWDLLNYEVERAQRHNYNFALIVIDLDNFKVLNDNYGHQFGDLYLKEFAKFLEKQFRKEDILARYGGDEFTVILPYTNKIYIEEIIQRFIEKLNNFYLSTPDSNLIKMTASIGVAIFPNDAITAKELFLAADEAMYIAKEEGKNCYRIFEEKTSIQIQRKEQLTSKLLLEIIETKDIIPYVQSIVNLNDNEIFAYEVLMRIHDDKNNIIPANRFIMIAEKMGIMQKLDLILFEKVLNFVSKTKNIHFKYFINLSPKTFSTKKDLEKIQSLIEKYNFYNIVFEITEREAIKDLNILREFIHTLKKYGIEFAIDDFGSGFSSYLYIKEIPVDYIKIEGNFIRTMLTNEIDKIFIESIVKMAKILKIKTIAEFVENKLIYEAIKESQIDYIQGNYINKPFPIFDLNI